MSKKVIFIFFLFFVSNGIFAQISTDSLFAQASKKLKEGDLENGLILLDSVLNIDNYHVQALASRAYLNATQNQNFDQVLDDLLQYSNITKSSGNFVEIGYLYLDQAQNDYAYQLADFAINKGFFNHNTYIIRGSAFFQFDKFKEAEKDFLKAIEIKNDALYAINLLIRTYIKLDQKEKALEWANQLIKLSPDDDIAYGIRAGVYVQMGDFEKALEDNNTSLQIVKELKGRAYFAEKRAFIYQEAGNENEACRWAVIAMRQGNNNAYFTLSYPCDTILHFDLATANTLLFRLQNPLNNYDLLSIKEQLLGLGLAIGGSKETEVNFMVEKAQFPTVPITLNEETFKSLNEEKETSIPVFNGTYNFIPASNKELFSCTKGAKAAPFYIQCILAQTADGSKSIWVDSKGIILKYVDQGYTLFELLKID